MIRISPPPPFTLEYCTPLPPQARPFPHNLRNPPNLIDEIPERNRPGRPGGFSGQPGGMAGRAGTGLLPTYQPQLAAVRTGEFT